MQANLIHKSRYLDGLKGIACLLVYIHHHEQWAHTTKEGALLERAFGYSGQYYLATLPWIRLVFSGAHFAVSIFFVISGYALSIKPLCLMHQNRQAELLECLSSAMFRRWLRLFAPVIATTFIFITMWHACGINIFGLPRQPTYLGESRRWRSELKEFTFLFTQDVGPSGYSAGFTYNGQLWTIPIEFKGSLMILASLLGLSQSSTKVRVAAELLLFICFVFVVDAWYGAMFVSGLLICEWEIWLSYQASFDQRQNSSRKQASLLLFVLGLFLAGVPHVPDMRLLRRNLGWYYLSFLNLSAVEDPKWFYLLWASILVVASVQQISCARRFLEERLCQFLARISFSLYLIHGPLLWTIGDRLYLAAGAHGNESTLNVDEFYGLGQWASGRTGPLGLEMRFVIPFLLLLPINLGLAELTTRLIDIPSRQVGYWLYIHSRKDFDRHK